MFHPGTCSPQSPCQPSYSLPLTQPLLSNQANNQGFRLITFQITTFDSKQNNMVYPGRSTLAADIDLLYPVEATEAQASTRIRPEYRKNSSVCSHQSQ
jgi:hypothetical protein